MRLKILPILCGTGLIACGGERVEIVKPPLELTQCADEPLAPDLPGKEFQSLRDQMTLAYILALRGAWGDCKSKVAGVKAWADGLGN